MLRAALTHASGAEHRLASNERLEFLGDAILGFVVCEMLFQQFPQYLEGELTKIKSVVVSRQTCAKISEALGLQEFLILGKGMTTHADGAAVAAGRRLRVAGRRRSISTAATKRRGSSSIPTLGPEVELAAAGELGGNYKSLLQQFAQREFGSTPTYHLLDEKGPDHSKCFKIVGPGRPASGIRPPGAAIRRKPSSGPRQRAVGAERRGSAVSVGLNWPGRQRQATATLSSRADRFAMPVFGSAVSSTRCSCLSAGCTAPEVRSRPQEPIPPIECCARCRSGKATSSACRDVAADANWMIAACEFANAAARQCRAASLGRLTSSRSQRCKPRASPHSRAAASMMRHWWKPLNLQACRFLIFLKHDDRCRAERAEAIARVWSSFALAVPMSPMRE